MSKRKSNFKVNKFSTRVGSFSEFNFEFFIPLNIHQILKTFFFLSVALSFVCANANASMKEAEGWVTREFQPSTLTQDQQLEEMAWFVEAAKPFQGLTIHVLSEIIDTHVYESEVLAKAFFEITGIKVVHHLKHEGDVVEMAQMQMLSERSIYDAYVNDTDLIGTHYRQGQIVPLSDFIEGEGRDVTLPTLDLDDFIGLSFGTGPDGKLYQLPDQQFANLYWFRHDWFSRPDLQDQFRAIFGYELGVPLNWSAYEDIADFFTNHVKFIDGERVYGHMDYGNRGPSLGWRMTDAWLAMAGAGDHGIPNGRPVDEWGIRMESCRPVGASVSRGGAADSPAAIYAVKKYIEWLHNFAPPGSENMTFSQAGPVPGQGHIAQQIFWYTAFTASLTQPDLPVVNDDGTPKWRMAPSPHGAYWEEGQKLGYQDAGAWTFFKSTRLERRKAAWLYAQFTVSKTVSLKKTLVGLTPIRNSDLNSEQMSIVAEKLGGFLEFYRSPARTLWTPTGMNVPDYPKLARLWWQNIGLAVDRSVSVEQAMTSLAREMDRVLARLERIGMGKCAPKLNQPEDKNIWLERNGSPKPALTNEDPPGRTISYEKLLQTWQQ